MRARWQDVVHLIKDTGFLFPLSEGEVMVVPPCFFMLSVATQESWGMRWSVHFKGTECSMIRILSELLLSHPALAQQGYEQFRSYLAKEQAAKAQDLIRAAAAASDAKS